MPFGDNFASFAQIPVASVATPWTPPDDVRIGVKNTFLELAPAALVEHRRSITMPPCNWEDSLMMTCSTEYAMSESSVSRVEQNVAQDILNSPKNISEVAALPSSKPNCNLHATLTCPRVGGDSSSPPYSDGIKIDAQDVTVTTHYVVPADVRVAIKNTFLEFGSLATPELRRNASMPPRVWAGSLKAASSDAESLPESFSSDATLLGARPAPENDSDTIQATRALISDPDYHNSASSTCMFDASPYSRYFEGLPMDSTDLISQHDHFYMGSHEYACPQLAVPMMVLVPVWGQAPSEESALRDVLPDFLDSSSAKANRKPLAGCKGNARSNAYMEGPKAVFADLSKLRPTSAASRKVQS